MVRGCAAHAQKVLHKCDSPIHCQMHFLTALATAGCGIEHKGARELVEACRAAGLKTAVASSADRVKVRLILQDAS